MRGGVLARTMDAMLITDRPSADVDALRTASAARSTDRTTPRRARAWNLAVDQRPAAVAFPATDADVIAAVNFAREEGLRVAPQGPGTAPPRPVGELTAGAMAWPWERAEEIFNAWRAWTETLPDEANSLCRLLQVPPLPTVPAPLRGRGS